MKKKNYLFIVIYRDVSNLFLKIIFVRKNIICQHLYTIILFQSEAEINYLKV